MSQEPPPRENDSATPAKVDPEYWVDAHGDYLFNFALGRLRNATLAEDMVQETFLAALKGAEQFAGRARERSWLTGILKNKIYDHFRRSSREQSFTDLQFFDEEEQEQFITRGLMGETWQKGHAPGAWEAEVEKADEPIFWKTYRECAGRLPQNVAAVFHMREVDDLSSRSICENLHISEGNLWVMLHRARMALRQCLEKNWFQAQ